MNNYLLLIDYNLSRFDDVKSMSFYAHERYHLKTILIRPNPSLVDETIADHIIDLNPRSQQFIDEALKALSPFKNKIIGGLVFSDNAVFSGATLLEKLGIPVDSAQLAEAAYSKITYRQWEAQFQLLWKSQHLFIPAFNIIYTLDELREFANQHPHGFVLKPACEGNNRGVMILRKEDDLKAAMKSIEMYLSDGIICEELITFDEEFSFDGIAHLHFITRKLSVKTTYPVEYGQIISGHLSSHHAELITRTGTIANLLVGQHTGPFHNEIKVSINHNKAAIIEPNRRPAGMRIWSLAEKVFNLNFYHLWIDQVTHHTLPITLPPPKGSAAIRMLGAPSDGELCLPDKILQNPTILLQAVLTDFNQTYQPSIDIDWFDFRLNKKTGDNILAIPRDNSDFIAQICVFVIGESIDIPILLDQFHRVWLRQISPYINTTRRRVA